MADSCTRSPAPARGHRGRLLLRAESGACARPPRPPAPARRSPTPARGRRGRLRLREVEELADKQRRRGAITVASWRGSAKSISAYTINAGGMANALRVLLALAVIALAAGGSCSFSFEFEEATIDSIQAGFKNGSLTSTALVHYYLHQISRLNPLLHAVIEVNPDALRQAARADAERSTGHRSGALHGVPVLIKDLIATRDKLNTTAGSLALLGSVVRRDAGVVSRLRRAGAVVLGKANLPEWANFRSARSTGGLHGWRTITGPLRALGESVRVEHGFVDSGGGEHGGGDVGDGNHGFHTLPGVAELGGGDQAHSGTDKPEKLKEFGQQVLLLSQNTTGIGPEEKAIIRQLEELSENGIVKLMTEHRLDAILTPDSDATPLIAYIGLPGIVVPAGYDEQGVPFSISYSGLKGYEPRLIEMAYAFEQATKVRKPPTFKT
nr:unnamed protein product [Digitaria exilis]